VGEKPHDIVALQAHRSFAAMVNVAVDAD
jgi:hypothetical protein